MAIGMRRRVGLVIFATALVGLVVYMAVVGLGRASLIAEVAGFFVGLAGLALAVADRSSPSARSPHGQDISDVVSGGRVDQEAPAGTPQRMTRVIAEDGVRQRSRSAAQAPSSERATEGDRDA